MSFREFEDAMQDAFGKKRILGGTVAMTAQDGGNSSLYALDLMPSMFVVSDRARRVRIHQSIWAAVR